jgi:hypothetical protein
VRRHSRSRTRTRQRLVQRAEQEVVDKTAVAEADFQLCGMDVDVHRTGVDLQEQQVGRMAPVVQDIGVGLANGVGDDAVAHRPAIDKEVLQVGLTPRRCRRAKQAAQAQAGTGLVQPAGVVQEGLVEHGRQPLPFEGIIDGLQPDRRTAIVRQAELDFRVRQRRRAHQFLDVAELGAFAAQELAPGRDVEEQLAHFHSAAARM